MAICKTENVCSYSLGKLVLSLRTDPCYMKMWKEAFPTGDGTGFSWYEKIYKIYYNLDKPKPGNTILDGRTYPPINKCIPRLV